MKTNRITKEFAFRSSIFCIIAFWGVVIYELIVSLAQHTYESTNTLTFITECMVLTYSVFMIASAMSRRKMACRKLLEKFVQMHWVGLAAIGTYILWVLITTDILTLKMLAIVAMFPMLLYCLNYFCKPKH